MESLIDDITRFCTQHGMTESQFGISALNDKNLLRDLRNGRRLWPETQDKVRTFIIEYRPEAA